MTKKPVRFTIPRDLGPERVADPPKIIPPRPNLEGDDAMFARFDPWSGEITSHGHMHRDHIAAEQASGAPIIEHDRHGVSLRRHRVDPKAGRLIDAPEPADADAEEQIAKDRAQELIRNLLALSDRYFMADSLDNITQAEQAQWRAYRKQLRAAYKRDGSYEILAAVPPDPKGLDLAGTLRPKGKS